MVKRQCSIIHGNLPQLAYPQLRPARSWCAQMPVYRASMSIDPGTSSGPALLDSAPREMTRTAPVPVCSYSLSVGLYLYCAPGRHICQCNGLVLSALSDERLPYSVPHASWICARLVKHNGESSSCSAAYHHGHHDVITTASCVTHNRLWVKVARTLQPHCWPE